MEWSEYDICCLVKGNTVDLMTCMAVSVCVIPINYMVLNVGTDSHKKTTHHYEMSTIYTQLSLPSFVIRNVQNIDHQYTGQLACVSTCAHSSVRCS